MPFMRALKRPWHWLAFLVGLLVLANLVILHFADVQRLPRGESDAHAIYPCAS